MKRTAHPVDTTHPTCTSAHVTVRPFALTYPQLVNQAVAHGWDDATVGRLRCAYMFAERMTDGLYRGQGVPLICHLVRTASIVLAEGGQPDAVMAAMLHAAPMLHLFGGSRRRKTRERDWDTLCDAAGESVTRLVQAYEAFPWGCASALENHLQQLDRYDAETRTVLLMRMANELEDFIDGGMRYRGCTDLPTTQPAYMATTMSSRPMRLSDHGLRSIWKIVARFFIIGSSRPDDVSHRGLTLLPCPELAHGKIDKCTNHTTAELSQQYWRVDPFDHHEKCAPADRHTRGHGQFKSTKPAQPVYAGIPMSKRPPIVPDEIVCHGYLNGDGTRQQIRPLQLLEQYPECAQIHSQPHEPDE